MALKFHSTDTYKKICNRSNSESVKKKGTQVMEYVVVEASESILAINGGSVPGHISTKPSCDRLRRAGAHNLTTDSILSIPKD